MQGADEPLCEAWEGFKTLLRKCPNHNFEVEMQMHILCNRLQPQTKMILDTSFSGLALFKTTEEAITIIEFMAFTDKRSQYGMTNTRDMSVKVKFLICSLRSTQTLVPTYLSFQAVDGCTT